MRFWTIFYCSLSLLVMLSQLSLGQYQPYSPNTYTGGTQPANNFYSPQNYNPGSANYFNSPQSLNNQPGNPQYQPYNSQPQNFNPYFNEPNNPQYQSFNNQPGNPNNFNESPRFYQTQPSSGQPSRFRKYNTDSNNPGYQAYNGGPRSFRTYNDNSRTPEYQSYNQPERSYGTNPNNPPYHYQSYQPGRFDTYNTGSNRPQYSSNPPQRMNNYNSQTTGPQNESSQRREVVYRNQQETPQQQTSNNQRRFESTQGTQTNGFSPSSTTVHRTNSNNPQHHVSNSQSSHGHHPSTVGHTHQTSKPPTPKPPSNDDPMKGHRIVCLFNNKHCNRNNYSPDLIDATLCTHINYEFAILDPDTYEMVPGDPALDLNKKFFEITVGLKKDNPRLKVLISLGGWEDSTEKYSIMAADEKKRKKFVTNAVTFITAHKFDGLDLAWEYPNCWKGALGVKPEDKPNFVKLLELLYTALKKLGLVFSISVGAVKREIEGAYDVPNIMKYVDFINVMTYDMHGPWEYKTGHHMQFDKMKDDEDPYCNVKAALQVWVDLGAEKKKINMGIATYGKTYTLENEDDHGLGAPSSGIGDSGVDEVEGGFVLYNTMCQWLNAGNWTEVENRLVGFYAYSGDQWACYDPPMMMVRKTKYLMEEGYGGVLIKDLGGDDFKGACFNMHYPLLKMCKLEMMQKIKRMYRDH